MNCLAKSNGKILLTMRVDMRDKKIKISFSNIKLSYLHHMTREYRAIAYDGPVNSQGDMDVIKPLPLTFGDGARVSINSGCSKSNW